MLAQESSVRGLATGAAPSAHAAARLRRSLPLAGMAFFALAMWVLHEQLPVDSYRDLVDALAALPRARLAAALAITVAGYAVLVGYDLVALRHLGEYVPLRDAASAALLAGALGNNLGNNLGNTLLAGSAVRFVRARIVLACADGVGNKIVAARQRVTPQTVSKWRARSVEQRLDGLLDAPRPGAPLSIDDARVDAVIA